MTLRTDHLARCIGTLEASYTMLCSTVPDTVEYEVYRNAVVKGFELTLETSVKLLRKALRAYAMPRDVDSWTFKDTLRHASKHGLLTVDSVERWFRYRDNRNNTAHDYGVGFAEGTLALLPGFIIDAGSLEAGLRERFYNAGD
ncbi:nucleotidyltransferase substrate binding protein [Candidatus Magnetominusculus xianensis]|uniref:nucleotidyltransferase substrate binding protein n=1 Tax=Candidatus Magnetominusculus xianensis TaxID=1748249 RepID=UPI000A121E6F|nr:nucleotidyltransferase substrate binding protein [Candidatus Magnetominusculus xianensis]MBF0403860.1 nucleotidyltransferase substrate binding protein [Nitrospirota bacterium]